jgi:cold shock CspA family protein/ribosome-associated translation inhibitor RaiA
MQVPLEIRFHNLDPSPSVETAVREAATKLEQFADDIISCKVTIEAPHKHHQQGNLFKVTVDVRLPGGEVVASRSPHAHHAHEDAHVALRDAFNAARRQIQDHVRVRRGKVKAHETPSHGEILKLDREVGYGRIRSADGRDVYFHRNSVVDADFDKLEPGMQVRFDEEPGDEGPQASTVHVAGKHHIIE